MVTGILGRQTLLVDQLRVGLRDAINRKTAHRIALIPSTLIGGAFLL
jgi:hypothetical protein